MKLPPERTGVGAGACLAQQGLRYGYCILKAEQGQITQTGEILIFR
jgi:hypothetical protein